MSKPKGILPILAFSLIMILSSCKNDPNRSSETENSEAPQLEELTPDDATSAESTPQQEEVEDLIQVEIPEPGSQITANQEIRGKARGTWFFEGDFPVYLIDENGSEIAVAIAMAQGEWMTTEWVEFTATLEFDVQQGGSGYLVFEKSNPSDKRELDREFRFPVSFTP